MRKVRYGVAVSLDGFIAGPKGEADWIAIDPEFDFAELWAQFDSLIMGRRTYKAALARLGPAHSKEGKQWLFRAHSKQQIIRQLRSFRK